MEEIIRLIDVSLYNEKHYGLTFTIDSDIDKYFKDNKIGYTYKYKEYQKMFYEPEKVRNNKINIMEKYDIYGDVKQTVIYDEDFIELLTVIKRGMKIIPYRFGENEYCTVELYEKKCDLLDGSTVYEIGYNKVFEPDETDITDMLYDTVLLIINIPIISYN